MLSVKGEHISALHLKPTAPTLPSDKPGFLDSRAPERPGLFGPAGRHSQGSNDSPTEKSAAALWFQFRFHPVVGGGGACGAPRVGVPDPGRQVSPRSRGALEAPVSRHPGRVWGVAEGAPVPEPAGGGSPGMPRSRSLLGA